MTNTTPHPTHPEKSEWREQLQNMSFDHECVDAYFTDVIGLDDAIKITEKAIAATEARVVEGVQKKPLPLVCSNNICEECANISGYNQALEDVRALFSSKT